VFERMFGASNTTDSRARLAQARSDRSILDAVTDKVARLERRVGTGDQQKLRQYLDAVRDVERRIQNVEHQASRELPLVERPMGIPETFQAHAHLMFDLQALAYQSDMTRSATFLFGRELTQRTFPEAGLPEPWHPTSHHQGDPEKLAKQAKLNTFHVSVFAYLLEKLAATPDGDGSLLDHTLLLLGSGMGNSELHLPVDLPTLVVAGNVFDIKGGRHLKYEGATPLANLQLTLLRKMDIAAERFGDSTRVLTEV
jgi:hypothetical protein